MNMDRRRRFAYLYMAFVGCIGLAAGVMHRIRLNQARVNAERILEQIAVGMERHNNHATTNATSKAP